MMIVLGIISSLRFARDDDYARTASTARAR